MFLEKNISGLSVIAYPKVNLALDILGKQNDYHLIQTVFYELRGEMKDEIIIESQSGNTVEIGCDNKEIPVDKDSLLRKTTDAFLKEVGVKSGIKIFLKKRILLESGLGGGSSDSVALLRGLAAFFGINKEILRPLALKLGSDCAFFINGGTALGIHFGEQVYPLPSPPPDLQIKIIDSGIRVLTAKAYAKVDIGKCARNKQKTDTLIRGLHRGDAQAIYENSHNDFEEFLFNVYPELWKKKNELELQYPHSKILLAGSGGAFMEIKKLSV